MTSLRFAVPLIGALACAQAQAQAQLQPQPDAPANARHITGKFDITITPAAPPAHEGRTALARMLLDKQYFGELQATGQGEMLTARTDTKGSAAYVAIERVTGTLNGRQGGFVIQHSGTMSGGASQLAVLIVPDSGSGGLAGISGKMAIKQVAGGHIYELDYVLP